MANRRGRGGRDVGTLIGPIQKNSGIMPEEKQPFVSGHNWGACDIDGNMLTFMVSNKQAFAISLADVSQMQLQGKTDVYMEFHLNDTVGANEKHSLMNLTFHIPTSNTQFAGDENRPAAQIKQFADVGSSEEPVVTFDGISILTPSIELYTSFLRIQGQANDFKIQYASIARLFVLPSNHIHTFVVITLDLPIRKGQTLYPHIVIQFETETNVKRDLTLSEDQLTSKYKDKLEPAYKGFIHEVFTRIFHGLSGKKVTGPSSFRSRDGHAVKSSLKAENGSLYPLEKGFFFLPKRPTLILYNEIDYVEFEWHGAGGSSVSSNYFDLLVRLKSGQEHLFRNIQRNEYHSLFKFISGKGLKIDNLGKVLTAAAVLQITDDSTVSPYPGDPKNQAGGNESDEEDEDFVAEKDDSESPTDDSDEQSDASESGGKKKKEKIMKKEAIATEPSSLKRKAKLGDEEETKKKRKNKNERY